MSIRLLILADTHVPLRAKRLPAEVWDAVDRADVVIHAGDWVDAALLDEIESRLSSTGGRLLAVYGNNDHGALRDRLPEIARATIDGLRIAVIHETGPAAGRESRAAADFPDTDLLVFGHSHIPWDSTTEAGLRLLNPGSPTDRRRQPHKTYLTAVVRSGTLVDVELHRLPA